MWSCACAPAPAAGRDAARHCQPFDRKSRTPDWPTPPQSGQSARPDTILGWYRKLVACKFDGSKARRGPGRPRIKREVEQLIIRMASESRDWGYDRIAGALVKLGYEISDQTVGNVLRRHGLPPAPERKRTTTWAAFIRTHLA